MANIGRHRTTRGGPPAANIPAAVDLTDNRRMDPAARRSVIMLAVIFGAMVIFAIAYLLGGGPAPSPSPVP